MGDFLMPSLGSDMEDGVLIEWEKNPGEHVAKGDIVAVVETQKGAIEIEAYEEGILGKRLIAIGQKVPVGTPLTTIETALQSSNSTASPSRIVSSPAARALAASNAIDLAALSGSGPSGAVLLADIEAAICTPELEPLVEAVTAQDMAVVVTASDSTQEPVTESALVTHAMDGMRSAIAAAMSRSKREIPHYYLSHSFSVQAAVDYVSRSNAEREAKDRLVLGVLFVKAVALAIQRFPEFNGHFDKTFVGSDSVHVGMAIAIRGGGLVAPAIHDAGQKTLDDLMVSLADLVTRVRAGRFRAAELSDPTVTVTSLGERGVDCLYGVIYPPQVAIVGFGTPVQQLSLERKEVVSSTWVKVTLAADHRVSDGHRGSLFLRAIARNLQKPEELS